MAGSGIDVLLFGLAVASDFDDASCRDHWELFDPPTDNEDRSSVRRRHQAALDLCSTCPPATYGRCAAQVRSLPPAQRLGVWAGIDWDNPVNLEEIA